jgi:predicted nucleic acid-binding protein
MPTKSQKTSLYLDVCTICRPFDNQKIMRIRLETDAIYLIMTKIREGIYCAIASSVHTLEVSAISDVREREEILALLSKFDSNYEIDLKKLRKRADHLYKIGFGVADAAHLAFAENTADAFITCDDKLLKKSRKENIQLSIYNPIEFIIKEDLH